jgi:hypothetical protein
MNTTRMSKFALLAGVALFAAVGCSEDTQDSVTSDLRTAVTEVGDAVGETTEDAAELAARNIATQQGEEQFANAGYPLESDLECTAEATDGADEMVIDCTGIAADGKVASLTGTTDELPGASVVSLSGSFVGMIDGVEVFNTDQLGG